MFFKNRAQGGCPVCARRGSVPGLQAKEAASPQHPAFQKKPGCVPCDKAPCSEVGAGPPGRHSAQRL